MNHLQKPSTSDSRLWFSITSVLLTATTELFLMILFSFVIYSFDTIDGKKMLLTT